MPLPFDIDQLLPRVKVVCDDVQEMLALCRKAVLPHRHLKRLEAGILGEEPPENVTQEDVDRFDDLTAVYGVEPIRAVVEEGQVVPWSTCARIILATMHVTKDRYLLDESLHR